MKIAMISYVLALCLIVSTNACRADGPPGDGTDGQKIWHMLPNWNVTIDLQSHSGDYTLYVDNVATGQLNNLNDTYWQTAVKPGVHEVILDGAPDQTSGRLEAWLTSNDKTEVHFLSETGTSCDYRPGGTSQNLNDIGVGPSRYAICQAAPGMAVRLQFVVGPAMNP